MRRELTISVSNSNFDSELPDKCSWVCLALIRKSASGMHESMLAHRVENPGFWLMNVQGAKHKGHGSGRPSGGRK